MQHNIFREIIISEASQEPYKQRKRLMFDDKNVNNWSQQNQQNIVVHTLSISTCKTIFSLQNASTFALMLHSLKQNKKC